MFFFWGGVLITKTRNFWEGKDPSFRRLTTTVTCKITSNDVMRFLLEVFCSPEFCWYKSRNRGLIQGAIFTYQPERGGQTGGGANGRER